MLSEAVKIVEICTEQSPKHDLIKLHDKSTNGADISEINQPSALIRCEGPANSIRSFYDKISIHQLNQSCDIMQYDDQNTSTDKSPVHSMSMYSSQFSDIIQCDGADTTSGESSNHSVDSTNSDEVDSNPVRPVLVPSSEQRPMGAPLQLEVATSGQVQAPSCVPLCAVTNPRSAWNKRHSIRTFLRQISPDLLILSEHWGRKKPFEEALAMSHYKVKESSRGMRGIPTRGRNGNATVSTTGGGVAIVYCEENFSVEDPRIDIPEGIEAVWLVLTPRYKDIDTVKKILVGGVYISPRSQNKQATLDHIIQTMFLVQSRYESQIRFLISGDFNRVNIQDVLDSNGALHQVCSVQTRNSTTLELVITDMATMFYEPTTLDPIQQDEHTKGKPSDHNVIIVAPRTDINFRMERQKRRITMRPQPKSKVGDFMCELGAHKWDEVYQTKDSHEKAQNFHRILLDTLNKHLQVKSVNMTSLDKPWFNPALKIKYNEMQKEFFKNRKSERWKKLKKNFKSSKRKAVKEFYNKFVHELKTTKPGQYHKVAKKLGGIPEQSGVLNIECIKDLTPQEQVNKVAESFAAVSQQYEPVDLTRLPAYLPAEQAPVLEVYKVYRKILGQKKTKSTLSIDIPENLRKEAAEFLAEPLTDIYNQCLKEGEYPKIWKYEWCTPVPKKKTSIKLLNDVRKIASTSDFSKYLNIFCCSLYLKISQTK